MQVPPLHTVPSWSQFNASRVYLITGAASGLGLATARQLVHEGHEVVGVDVQSAALDTACAELGQLFKPILCDVTSPQSVAEAAASLEELQPDGVDAVLHFAALDSTGPTLELGEDSFARAIDVNVTGVWRAQRAFFPALKKRRGLTVLISSEVAFARLAHAFAGAYSPSKAALDALAHGLRQELACLEPPMRVSLVHLGVSATRLLERASAAFSRHAERCPRSEYVAALPACDAFARWYTAASARRRENQPEVVARRIHAILASRAPRGRYSINVSWLMWLASRTPQWVLDALVVGALRARLHGGAAAHGARELASSIITALVYLF